MSSTVGDLPEGPETWQLLAPQDLDLDMRLALAKGAHAALMRQIEADAALLARMHVMDYSLLLGVHYPKWGPNTWDPPHTSPRGRPPPPSILWSRSCVPEYLPHNCGCPVT